MIELKWSKWKGDKWESMRHQLPPEPTPPPAQTPAGRQIQYLSLQGQIAQPLDYRSAVKWVCCSDESLVYGITSEDKLELKREIERVTPVYDHHTGDKVQDKVDNQILNTGSYSETTSVILDLVTGKLLKLTGLVAEPEGTITCTEPTSAFIMALILRNVKPEHLTRGLKDRGIENINGINIHDYKFIQRDLRGWRIQLGGEDFPLNQFIWDLQHFANVVPKVTPLKEVPKVFKLPRSLDVTAE